MKYKLYLILFPLLAVFLNLSAAPEVLRVIPNKINYNLKEKATISVTLANKGNKTETAELILVDKWDIDRQKVITKQKVTLAPGSEKTFPIAWNSGTVRYGHEIRAILLQNGKEVSAKSEFFNVINEWWRVNVGITPNVIGGTPQGDRLCAWYGYKPYNTRFSRFFHDSWGSSPIGPFATYFTNTTPWNRAMSTFGKFYESSYKDTDVWYAVSEKCTYADFYKDAALCEKWGVHRTMMTIYCTTNNYGFELGRKHPQYFIKDGKGDFKYHLPLDPYGLSRKNEPYTGGWSFISPDFTRKDVWKLAMDSVIEGVIKLKHNGVYFDGAYRCMDGFDHTGKQLSKVHDFDALNRELSAYVNQRLRTAKKDIYFWVNAGETGSFRNILSNPASGTLWELNNFHQIENNTLNVWNTVKETAVNMRNELWHTKYPNDVKTNILHIGYSMYPTGLWYVGPSAAAWAKKGQKYNNFLPSKQYWALNSHTAAIIAAVCGHPYGEGAAYRPFTQIMTRYSSFYWGEDVKLFRKAFRRFKLDSLRDIWWEDFVYTRETKDYKDYYIHLVNTPDNPRHSWRTIKETKAAKGVEVSSRLFKDLKRVKAWTIQPYGSEGAVLEPIVDPVKINLVDDEAVFPIPPFRYYTLLVIREMKKR